MTHPSAASRSKFFSAKTRVPIELHHPALRTALVQASLDPAVRAITQSAQIERVGGVDPDAIVLTRDDGRHLLDVVPARAAGLGPVCEDVLRRLGFGVITLTAADLRSEPLRSNCDLVWAHAGWRVPLDLRLGILQALVDDGPLPLGELCRRVRCERDPVAATMALGCLDLLEFDLSSAPIGPATTVRSRT